MRNWYHEVSDAWLEARRSYITATELVGLISAYKREVKSLGKNKKLDHIPKDFAALWAEKNSMKESDPASFNAAARGHIMEPYAIKAYNSQSTSEHMYHWDDALIYNDVVAFSPDGLDIVQPSVGIAFCKKDGEDSIVDERGTNFQLAPHYLIEVKSYDVGKHTKCMLTPPMQLDERMQVAVAMIVCDTIEKGTICFYNPQAYHSMFTRIYSRKDLKDDMELLTEVISMYKKTCEMMEAVPFQMDAMYGEEYIYDQYLKEKISVISNMEGGYFES